MFKTVRYRPLAGSFPLRGHGDVTMATVPKNLVQKEGTLENLYYTAAPGR